MSEPVLRPYQLAADAAITQALSTHRSTLLVMATGTGKTVVFCARARRTKLHGGRTLILAHRDELIQQPRRKLLELGVDADVERGKSRASLLSRVVIASVQSLRGARLARFPPDHFAEIIVDEAHHAMAPGYRAILDHFAPAKILGVTATPIRADGKALGEVFETVAYRYEIRAAIAEGYLVPIVARRVVVDGVDLSGIRTRAGDLAQDDLSAAMATQRALDGVVGPLLDLARDMPTVVFGVDVAHAASLAAGLNDRRPGCARAVSGMTDEHERAQLLEDFAAGAFQYLTNCALLTEGWDAPHVQCVAIARPTKSWALYVQMVGRGTRPSPETSKRRLELLNFTGRAGKHRLVGPVDCLAGSDQGMAALADDLRVELDRLLGTQTLELADALERAELDVGVRRQRLAADAIVAYRTEHVDPFLGPEPGGGPQQDMAWAARPPTAAQLAALDKGGATVSALPPSFSMADASRLLSRMAARASATPRLCTLRQAKRIAAGTGIDTRELTFDRAMDLLAMLRLADWRPTALRNTPEWRAAHADAASDEAMPLDADHHSA